MVFYAFLGLVSAFVLMRVARSKVMRAWLHGRGNDPSSTTRRDDEAFRGTAWNDDGYR
jgi:hypothetical protein